MCGIVGIIGKNACGGPEDLLPMRDRMTHRGPDDAGIWSAPDGLAHFGHRRLAIIDLSAAAHQPMIDEASGLVIVFNGEIYNFQDIRRVLEAKGHCFRSLSDTEVILRAYEEWGSACLGRFNGMFAFAIYNPRQRSLFLARDRAGEKPLYYWHSSGRLVFASELKAILQDHTFPREMDWSAFQAYLAYGYVPGDQCIFRQARKLPPGHAMTYHIDTDRLEIHSYWQLPLGPGKAEMSIEAHIEEFEGLLRDAVTRQMVADVPVGILLSGGVDSSLVTALASQAATRPVKTFTVTFPGHAGYDEGPYARLVAEYFGTEHIELTAEKADPDILPLLARQFDEPLADHALVPTYLLARLIRKHVTVALGGDGGDELFGGYPHYTWIKRQAAIRPYVPQPLRRGLAFLSGRLLPPGVKGRNHLIGIGQDLPHAISHVNLYFDASLRQRIVIDENQCLSVGALPEEARKNHCSPGQSPLYQVMAADFHSTLADGYLVKVDRSSMLASLEVRAPFLDYRLIEFAFGSLPDCLKVAGRERKILPRRLAERLLPKNLDIKRKQGFTMPLTAWFQGDWGDFFRMVLSDASPDLFDRQMIDGLLEGQRRGYANINRIFSLAMFELWRREYQVALPRSTS